jgi:hypothetical protein
VEQLEAVDFFGEVGHAAQAMEILACTENCPLIHSILAGEKSFVRNSPMQETSAHALDPSAFVMGSPLQRRHIHHLNFDCECDQNLVVELDHHHHSHHHQYLRTS